MRSLLIHPSSNKKMTSVRKLATIALLLCKVKSMLCYSSAVHSFTTSKLWSQITDDAVSATARMNGINKALIQKFVKPASALACISILGHKSSAASRDRNWEQVQLPVKETLFDMCFDPVKPTHGWIVGAKGTFLETFDSGLNWNARTFSSLDEDGDFVYRFEVASLTNDEGWMIGKPAIMLHTRDGGKQFERIPLSPKLPGDPCSIVALGPDKAEMITSRGAIYTTANGGLNWQAQVKETIDATLNRVSSSGTSGASFFTGTIINQASTIPK